MAAPKTIRRKAGDPVNTLSTVEEQVNLTDVLVAIDQLAATLNKLIAAYNVHQHSALNAVPSVGLIAGSADVAAVDLFVTADQ